MPGLARLHTAMRHVTADNLDKTRRLMGQATRDWCARNNVSTGWTGVPLHTPAPEALPEWHGYR